MLKQVIILLLTALVKNVINDEFWISDKVFLIFEYKLFLNKKIQFLVVDWKWKKHRNVLLK